MILARYCFVIILAVVVAACNPGSSSDDTGQDSEQSGRTEESESVTESNGDARNSEHNGSEKVIVFFGDSITAGYGIERSQSFPALIEDRFLDAGYNVEVRNAGVSGETTAGGLRRIEWVLNQHVDLIVVELGGNDGLRGIPVSETRNNLKSIIATIKETYPAAGIILAGMQLPPNLGQTYTSEFADLFKTVADEESVSLIPFILDGVGGIPRLNQSDGIHPTAEGHEVIAEHIWPTMREAIDSLESR